MNVDVGDTLTIRGKNFIRGKNRNTVVFKRDSSRAVFVKSTLATGKQIRVVASQKLREFLPDNTTARFRLRVLSRRFSKKFTSNRNSPNITARPLPADGTPGSPGSTPPSSTPAPPAPVCTGDQDGDMLDAGRENALGLDACKADSDGDGVEDGYEYQSARDLNDDEYQDADTLLPYPGKRPYPNPLFKDDAVDHDGDGLAQGDEYRLWKAFGARPAGTLPRDDYQMLYSDGRQYSVGPGGTPGLRAGSYPKGDEFLSWASSHGYNPVLISKSAPWYDASTRVAYDIRDVNHNGTVDGDGRDGYLSGEATIYDKDSDGFLSDDERDEDADGLTNLDELRGRMSSAQWAKCYASVNEKPYPVEYAGTDLVDRDSDGDGVIDGADDQDHDDIPNIMELSRNMASGEADWDAHDGTCVISDAIVLEGPDGPDADSNPDPLEDYHADVYGRVNPFNPCLPYTWSRTCARGVEFGAEFAPFDGSTNWFALQ